MFLYSGEQNVACKVIFLYVFIFLKIFLGFSHIWEIEKFFFSFCWKFNVAEIVSENIESRPQQKDRNTKNLGLF